MTDHLPETPVIHKIPDPALEVPRGVSEWQPGGPPAKKIPIYFYPERNPLYAQFVDKYPYSGRPALIRKLFMEGYVVARPEFETWLAQLREDAETPPPLVESQSTRRSRYPYTVYLSARKPEQRPILEYLTGLDRTYKQTLLRLALVRGMMLPNVEQLIQGL